MKAFFIFFEACAPLSAMDRAGVNSRALALFVLQI
jgi:hypothetical protein